METPSQPQINWGIVINENIMREETLVITDLLTLWLMLNFIKISELYTIITCKTMRKKNTGNCGTKDINKL